MSETNTIDREAIGEEIARAIAPDEWAEFDAGKGTCTNGAFWKIKDSMFAACIAMNVLSEKGAIIIPKQSAEGKQAMLEEFGRAA